MNPDGFGYNQVNTPIGQLTVVASQTGLRRILFSHLTPKDSVFLASVLKVNDHPIVTKAITQLEEYFFGQRQVFEIPIEAKGTDFQMATWRALGDIEFGKTSTYGAQAVVIGAPRAVRAVGSANRCNPVPIVWPCHRIIGSDGKMTGFAGGLEVKRWLLDHERARVWQK